MPVPQENLSFVEQASCLLLTDATDICSAGDSIRVVTHMLHPCQLTFYE